MACPRKIQPKFCLGIRIPKFAPSATHIHFLLRARGEMRLTFCPPTFYQPMNEAAGTRPIPTKDLQTPENHHPWPSPALSDEEKSALDGMYNGTVESVRTGQVIEGEIVDITDREIIVNVGYKGDGLVALSEFKNREGLQVGNAVEVYVEAQEDAQGQLVLSHKKAKLFKAWESIKSAFAEGGILEALVKRRTKGGLIVDIHGVEAFLPGSQIDLRPVKDFDIYVGKTIEVVVVKINYANDNVVVSHKALLEKGLESQKAAIISNLEKGQILEGTVKNMTSFGVFVDLGGVDGLLHITDIAWSRVSSPEDALELGQKIKVVVTDFNEDKKRISLSMKQLQPHPWEALPESIQVGSKVQGTIVNTADYGAFVEVLPGIEGLIHISEMSWSQYPTNTKDLVKVGDKVDAMVLTLDRVHRKMSLGMKQVSGDPWQRDDFAQRYAPGTLHEGTVRNLTHFGAFIELEEGIEGLLHVSDMSWLQKVSHPSELLKAKQSIRTMVLEVDAANKKLSLGLKQLQENPWDKYEEAFEVGSVHEGTVVRMVEKGAMVALDEILEGFAPNRHLMKASEQPAVAGEKLPFKVIEFSKEHQRVLLSHTATFSDDQELETSRTAPKANKRSSTLVRNFVTTEKSTLGDLEALASLREKMSDQSAQSGSSDKETE